MEQSDVTSQRNNVASFAARRVASGARRWILSLRVNVTGDPAMMDPITYSELVAGRILDNIYEGFTDKTADGKISQALATDWEAADRTAMASASTCVRE